MHLTAGSVSILLIVGGIAGAMGAEDETGHKIRPAANLAVNQAMEDPRVKAHGIISEKAVEQACDTGANEWCSKAQQQHQLSGQLISLVFAAIPIWFCLKFVLAAVS